MKMKRLMLKTQKLKKRMILKWSITERDGRAVSA